MGAKRFLKRGAPEAVRAIIGCVNEQPFHDLLELRYLRRLKWRVIAEELGYEERYVYKLHEKALRRVEALMGNAGGIAG